MERGERGVSSSLTEVRSEASLLKIHLVKTVSMGRKKVGGSPSWVSRAVPLLGCGVNALTASTPLSLLRTLLGRLGKSDEHREGRDQSGQVFHDQSAIPSLILGQPSTGAFDLIHVHWGPGFKDKSAPPSTVMGSMWVIISLRTYSEILVTLRDASAKPMTGSFQCC